VLCGVLVAHPATTQPAASDIRDNDKNPLKPVLRCMRYIDTEVGRFCMPLMKSAYHSTIRPTSNQPLPELLGQLDTFEWREGDAAPDGA